MGMALGGFGHQAGSKARHRVGRSPPAWRARRRWRHSGIWIGFSVLLGTRLFQNSHTALHTVVEAAGTGQDRGRPNLEGRGRVGWPVRSGRPAIPRSIFSPRGLGSPATVLALHRSVSSWVWRVGGHRAGHPAGARHRAPTQTYVLRCLSSTQWHCVHTAHAEVWAASNRSWRVCGDACNPTAQPWKGMLSQHIAEQDHPTLPPR